jgi:hypothetical protein
MHVNISKIPAHSHSRGTHHTTVAKQLLGSNRSFVLKQKFFIKMIKHHPSKIINLNDIQDSKSKYAFVVLNRPIEADPKLVEELWNHCENYMIIDLTQFLFLQSCEQFFLLFFSCN